MMWQPIETAPKDRPILVWFDHDQDNYEDPENPGKLTPYACYADGGDFFQGSGVTIAKWSDEWWENDGWESAGPGYFMPGVWSAWFNGDFADHVVNALFWMPMPDSPTAIAQNRIEP